jgi:preprotein translocase subunit SecF
MGKASRLGNDLYTGRKSIDFVNRRPTWYAITGVVVLLAFAALFIKGLNFGIEFTGGTEYRVPVASATQETADELGEVVAGTDIEGTGNPIVTTAGGSVLIQVEDISQDEGNEVAAALSEATGVPVNDLTINEIGASFGAEVATRAVIGVIVFLVLVLIFIAFYFREWKMSVGALVALIHDVVITMGVYALSGFQVTPSAVTGLLAILGFSLYDTVVVFDKVKENTRDMKANRQTYAEAANLAVNQTLVRSINTGIVALIPIGAILWVSAVQLGASSLQDLALSQFVGMAAGVYSSVVLAPRIVVHLKANETEVKLAERRAKARKRAEADKYASVPSFTEDMPVGDDPDGSDDDLDEIEIEVDERATPTLTKTRPGASEPGKGRAVPPSRGPVQQSGSSGRQQPSRQPKSKRGK